MARRARYAIGKPDKVRAPTLPVHRRARRPVLQHGLCIEAAATTRRILGTIVRSRDWIVCGEAEDGWSGVKKFQELRPDLVLLDLTMPDINGLEAARMTSGSDPTVPIILFTAVDADGLENAARNVGICAVVPKTQSWNLLKTIETAIIKSIQ
jgi:two-component system, chemotaxis family, chemotaxis protein CheY